MKQSIINIILSLCIAIIIHILLLLLFSKLISSSVISFSSHRIVHLICITCSTFMASYFLFTQGETLITAVFLCLCYTFTLALLSSVFFLSNLFTPSNIKVPLAMVCGTIPGTLGAFRKRNHTRKKIHKISK